jgi:hypothetical protein
VTAVILLPTLLYPFGRDQSTFAYVGGIIARGGMPYRDAWDVKPPGIYLAYAALWALYPTSASALMAAVRVADVAIAVLTALLLARLAARWLGPAVALPAAAAYAAMYGSSTYWSLAQAESWANPFVLGSLLLGDRAAGPGARRAAWFFAAALLAGCAAALKYPSALPALPFLVLALVAPSTLSEVSPALEPGGTVCESHSLPQWGRARVGVLLSTAVVALGLALPLAVCALWLHSGGALQPYLDIQSSFVAPYARLSRAGLLPTLRNAVSYTATWLWQVQLFTVAAVAGLVAHRVRAAGTSRTVAPASGLPQGVPPREVVGCDDASGERPSAVETPATHAEVRLRGRGAAQSTEVDFAMRSRDFQSPQPPNGFRLSVILLLGGCVSVWLQGKYFTYHWEAAYPGLALLAAAGIVAALKWLRVPRPCVVPAALLGILLWAAVTQDPAPWTALERAAGRMDEARWLAEFDPKRPGRSFSFRVDRQTSRYIDAHAAPGDRLLMWGFEPPIYLLTSRPAPTRFFFNVPVASPFAPERWRREFLAGFAQHPPEWLVVARNDAIPWATGLREDSASQLRGWPELWGLVRTRYRFETQIEYLDVYRLGGKQEESGDARAAGG